MNVAPVTESPVRRRVRFAPTAFAKAMMAYFGIIATFGIVIAVALSNG